MKSLILHFTLISTILFLCGCQSCRKETATSINPVSLKKISRPEFAIQPGQIHKYIRQKDIPETGHSAVAVAVNRFYREEQSFLWLGKYSLSQQADTLISWLENSYRHGLNPERFSLSKIKNNLKKLSSLKFDKEDNINNVLADLEYNLTTAYLHYVCGLSFGFTNPHQLLNTLEDEEGKDGKPLDKLPNGKTIKKELYATPLKSCDTEFIRTALDNAQKGRADSFLRSIQPTNPFYLRLQKEYDRLQHLRECTFSPIPLIGDTLLKAGDKHYTIPLIINRLSITGELSGNPDPANELTQELLNAINRFRKENLIANDNSVGTYTIRILNRPVGYYKDRLRVNMERLRWQPQQDKGDKYIRINIAASMLQAINTKADTLEEMKVCVGNYRNKTPLLSSTVRYMEMNPYWNVPQSIIMKEMIPAYKKDTSYFSRNRLRIYDKEGREINPHTINWTKYQKGVPYDIKQDNKDGNSLGRIIFRFPNTHSVYLHDTPSRYAFRLNNRAISHGCVRLEKALNLAFFLLDEQEEVIKDRIRLAIDLPPETEAGKKLKAKENYKDLAFYSFRQHIPLFMEYYTNYLSKNGELSYCEDIYQFDAPVLEALDKLN